MSVVQRGKTNPVFLVINVLLDKPCLSLQKKSLNMGGGVGDQQEKKSEKRCRNSVQVREWRLSLCHYK